MDLLMLTFIICGLLTLVTKAGWEVKKCWKNNVGRCRQKCLHVERYKLLCMNKLSCCIPITSDEDYTPRPLPPRTPIEDVTMNFFPNSPVSGLDDSVAIDTSETEESTVPGTVTPMPATSPQAASHSPENAGN
nr:beta-defensin 125 [Equus asinus]